MIIEVRSLGVGFAIRSSNVPDLDTWFSLNQTVQRMIPGVEVFVRPDIDGPSDAVISRHGDQWNFVCNGTVWRTRRIEDVASLVEGVLERRRQEELGVCAIHGTVVAHRGCAILFIGSPDCGKTSLALTLRHKGMLLLTDDKSLVSLRVGEVVGGRRCVRAQPHLVAAGLLPDPIDRWIPLDPWPSGSQRLTLVVFPAVSNTHAQTRSWRLDSVSAAWEIFPLLSEAIALPRQVDDFESAAGGNDNDALAGWRATATREFCRDLPVVKIAGNTDDAANLILEMLDVD